MFSTIGITEIIMIFVITILIVKPEDFPKFLRKIGQYYGKFHTTMFKFKSYTRDTYDQITHIDTEDSDLDDYSHEDSDYKDEFHSGSPNGSVSMTDQYEDEDEESGYDLYFSDDEYAEGYDDDLEENDDYYGDIDDEIDDTEESIDYSDAELTTDQSDINGEGDSSENNESLSIQSTSP